jgi:hypothetical protein
VPIWFFWSISIRPAASLQSSLPGGHAVYSTPSSFIVPLGVSSASRAAPRTERSSNSNCAPSNVPPPFSVYAPLLPRT